MLSYVQGIRQHHKTCPTSDCSANISRNSSTVINDVLLTQCTNTDPKARNALLVFTSGRFDNIEKVREDVGVLTRDTGFYVFALGAGYGSNIDGLQAIAQEPSNVFVVTEDNLQTLDAIQSQLSYIICS
ncbi:hypothetical protein DPMN_099640 [Dreissena polymorpha]|uniref:VWFA domain-containing protein n=1 Tax=Dreissena polymorpha TaxID=45954 RepID=A0A9D4LG01_DREPO|nr:hypothetical protein DPMN_099640 [Dreissena polymorpha]